MKKLSLLCIFTSALSMMLIASPNLYAAGFVYRNMPCPGSQQLIPPGGRIELQDIMLSADKDQRVNLFFGPPRIDIATVYLKANESVVVNLTGQVESEEEQALRVDCTGTAGTNLGVTVTGQRIGDPF